MRDTAIEEVEQLLNKVIAEDSSVLNEAGHFILSSGGKRIRPYFVLLSGSFGHSRYEDMIKTATALEIIHMASLVHDDYIDNSIKRRGAKTIHEQWSPTIAVETGHYLLAAALRLVAEIDNPAYHEYLSSVILEVCFGEFDQMNDRYKVISFTNYLRRINRKTAILIEASCRLGAMSTAADDQAIFHLKKFGHFMGMSYQIIDDMLDYTSSEAELGKPVGSDIRNGHVTLPLLCALKNSDELHILIKDLSNEQSDDYFDRIIALVTAHGINEAAMISRKYAEKAKQHLLALPETFERYEMEKLLNRMTDRSF